MSEKGHVILLDCRSLEHQQIPIKIEPYKIIMLNTKVSHNLASSEYNTRKRECEEGVEIIRKKFPEVISLRDVTPIMIKEFQEVMDETLFKRCSFIVSENERVLKAAKALKENNLKLFGALLYEAHDGISKLYEVSCPESDFLVEFSKQFDAVLGARQTGGGFGGCTLNIVHKDQVNDFVEAATKAYKVAFNIELEAFEVKPSAGTYIQD
jgi:galactokinase